MRKFISRSFALIMTAAMLVSLPGVAQAAEIAGENQTEETIVSEENEISTDGTVEETSEELSEDEKEFEEGISEENTEEFVENDSEEETEENTEETSEIEDSEVITEETSEEETEEITEEISANEDSEEIIEEAIEETSEEITEEAVEEDAEEIDPEEICDEVEIEEELLSAYDDASNIAKGKSNDITWYIDKNGKLVVSGEGNWESRLVKVKEEMVSGTMYVSPWYEHRRKIKSAVVDLKEITDVSDMFFYCVNLTEVDFTNFDTSDVAAFAGMFEHCEKMKNLNLSSFNTQNANSMVDMFWCCYSLETLDISGFNTENVEYMSGMFGFCKKLKAIDVSSFDTSKCIEMADMFGNCSALEELDLSNFNTEKAERMDLMFAECSKLKSLDLSSFVISEDTTMDLFMRSVYPSEGVITPKSCAANIEMKTISGKKWYKFSNGEDVLVLPETSEKIVSENKYYFVTYKNSNGDNMIDGIYAVPKKTKTTFPQLSRPGYTFKGWYNAKTNKKVTSVTGKTITVSAKWSLNKYSIKYNLNSGSFTKGTDKQTSYTYFSPEITLPIPERKYYNFKGWYKDKNFTEPITSIPAGSEGNISLYAKWEGIPYTLLYHRENEVAPGESGGIANCNYGTTYKIADSYFYTKTGYYIAGWSTTPNGKIKYKPGQKFKNLTKTEGDVIALYPQWKEITYTIKYAANGGKGSMKSQTVKGLNKVTLRTNTFKKKGYHFSRWQIEGSYYNYVANAEIDANYLNPKNKQVITMIPVWEQNKYTINLNLNGGKITTLVDGFPEEFLGAEKIPSEGFGYADDIMLPNMNEWGAEKDGYIFYCWNTKANGKGKDYYPTSFVSKLAPEGEFELYAKWIRKNENGATFMFMPNEGSGKIVCINTKSGQKEITAPSKGFTKKGMKFTGWKDVNGDKFYKAGSKIPLSDFNFKAGDAIELDAVYEPTK